MNRNALNLISADFLHSKNHSTSQRSDTLYGFSLQANTYKANIRLPLDQEIAQYKVIENVYANLQKK